MRKLSKVKRKINQRKRKAGNPYANINWEKASTLFKLPLPEKKKKSFLSAKLLLQVLAATGAIGLIFAFPGAAAGVSALFIGKKSYPRWQTKQIIDQLDGQNYLKTKYNDDGTVTVNITQKGMVRALTYRLDSMQLKKPNRWDKKWRVVIFDIPEKYRGIRDIFRMRLRQLGLYQFQKSIYVSPFACSQEIEFLRELYGIPFTVKYMLVEKIEDDEFLRERFDLS